MVFDTSVPDIHMNSFQRQDCSYSIYSSSGEELKKVLPTNVPQPLGNGLKICCFVDADHAGESLALSSRTGFIVMLDNSPVYWYSKKQSTIDASKFGSKFMAMKQAAEYLRVLC